MQAFERQINELNISEVTYRQLGTEFGTFHIATCERGLFYASWDMPASTLQIIETWESGEASQAYAEEIMLQLESYFDGRDVQFTVPLVFRGTAFQEAVWNALREIPFGETWSYQDLAFHIGNPKAVRAVGQANRANRLAVIIPCHRVIGANGKLVGYAGDATDLKAKLLNLEYSTLIVSGELPNLAAE